MDDLIFSMDSRFRDHELYPNSGKFVCKLNYKIKNAIYIRLSSIELPNIYYTFTKVKDNISFIIKIINSTYTVTIPEGSYTSELMLNVIQEQLDLINNYKEQQLRIIFNEITSKTTIVNKNNVSFELQFANTTEYPSLGKSLGFINTNYLGKSLYISESVLNVIGDTYIFVKINDYGFTYHKNQANNILAKIVLRKNKNYVTYDDESNLLTKTYTFATTNIDKIFVELLDPYLNVIDMVGQDFSFTLEIGFPKNIYHEVSPLEQIYESKLISVKKEQHMY